MSDASAFTAASIFISYDRWDVGREAKRLAEHLKLEFRPDQVFIDTDLAVGDDYAAAVERQVQQCRVMLVLIGPRGLDGASQFLRHDVGSALRRGLSVIPVLIDVEAIPGAEGLPVDLQPLVERQAVLIRHDSFDRDVLRLVEALSKSLGQSLYSKAPSPRTSGSQRKVGTTAMPATPASIWRAAFATSLSKTYRRVSQVLHPRPGEVLVAAPVWRLAWWLALAALLLWGVVWPYVWPALMPAPAAVVATEEALPAATGPVLPVGARFRDCRDASCPWLRVLPAGTFTMGSPDDEPGREKDEGPQHQVTVARPFAVMETEVTVGQFATFVRETGYQVPSGCSIGFEQTSEDPVVCVSWHDARAFARWLTRRTGQPYRLLSEAEWEYAARAGTTTPFAFGKQIDTSQANFNGNSTYNGSAKGEHRQKTLPVGSLAKNTWGLYDMHGNAWEWVQDCYGAYTAGPRTADAVDEVDFSKRLVRGGGWSFHPEGARSANRDHGEPAGGDDNLGFRLARMLP